MKVQCIVGFLAALASGAVGGASECSLTVAGETIEFQHAVARATPNHFDESKENVIVHCFREKVPVDRLSASKIIWFRPDSGRIDIELSPDGDVTLVSVTSHRVEGMISGANFGVEFDGTREGDQLAGSVKTTKDLTTLLNGEKSEPWRVSAKLEVEVMKE